MIVILFIIIFAGVFGFAISLILSVILTMVVLSIINTYMRYQVLKGKDKTYFTETMIEQEIAQRYPKSYIGLRQVFPFIALVSFLGSLLFIFLAFQIL